MTSRAPQASFVRLPAAAEAATVLDFLCAHFPRVPAEEWRRRFAAGTVLGPDGAPLAAGAPYVPGLRVSYFRELPSEPPIPFTEEVLLASADFLVVDKPPFLPVVPAGRFVNECLLYRLRQKTGNPDLQPVHRLDRETRGLVLLSCRAATRRLYHRLFDERAVDKEYLAIGAGVAAPTWQRQEVEGRIVRGAPFFRMAEVDGPPNAHTSVELVAWRAGALQTGRGLFRLRPTTGRKHQLRLHLARLGVPIENDRLYPDLAPQAADDFHRPLQLLARRLRFTDPASGESIDVASRQQLDW